VRRIARRTTFEDAVADEVRTWLGLTIEERIRPRFTQGLERPTRVRGDR
jgi:hypothetical protein